MRHCTMAYYTQPGLAGLSTRAARTSPVYAAVAPGLDFDRDREGDRRRGMA